MFMDAGILQGGLLGHTAMHRVIPIKGKIWIEKPHERMIAGALQAMPETRPPQTAWVVVGDWAVHRSAGPASAPAARVVPAAAPPARTCSSSANR